MDRTYISGAKLRIPAVRPNYICRDIPNKKLDEGLKKEHKIFLISVPAGYGKTTLVSGWISQLDEPCAWLSLDKYDNDPIKFIRYLLEAVRKVNKSFGVTVQDLTNAPKLPEIETVSLYLMNELEQFPQPLILVLDNYHVIEHPYIHEMVQNLLGSRSLRLIISTRQKPPIAFSRWRVRDKMTELNFSDLKFSGAEIKEFFGKSFNIVFDDDMLQTIETQTEGWAASMQLTGLSIKNMDKAQAKRFIKEQGASNRFIADYLMDEVVKMQEEQTCGFLYRTCMLKKFNRELCVAVTGIADSKKIIDRLEKDNLFIVALDHSHTWYRYHPLFSELLKANMDDDRKAELCKNASLWCEENGFAEEALEYALEAKDGEAAASLVKGEAISLFQKGKLKTLLSWLNSVSEINQDKESTLELYRAWCLLISGEMDEANRVIDSFAHTQDGSNPVITGMVKAAMPFQYNSDDKKKTLQYAKDAVTVMKDQQGLFYYGALIALGHANGLNGHTREAAAWNAKAHGGACRKGYLFLQLLSLHDLAFYLNCMGRRREALALCEKTLERVTDSSKNPLKMIKIVYLSMGMLLYASNQLGRAKSYLEEGIAAYQELAFAHLIGLGEWHLVLLLYHLGEKEKAFEMVYRLQAHCKDLFVRRISLFFEALEMELHLREGNIAKVSAWLREPGSTFDAVSGILDIYPYFTYIRAMIAQKEFDKARLALEDKQTLLRKEGRYGELITVLLLLALVTKHLDNESKALGYVREALAMAAPEGYERYFLDEGSELLELAYKARDAAPAFVDKLFPKKAKKPQALAEPLKKREIEILVLIAKGLSNHEIAEMLYITTGTTKWYIKNIFAKLGVNKRTQAVDRARRLEIIR
ncbi:LuxR C-terminal-related transcriptional regulator [Oscillospiraceae bacterium MB08-C2-2]|nr:LuxR C-terminal-related transcriptional regulator [Oscillospiraceae bacterium MB08-C2-2]